MDLKAINGNEIIDFLNKVTSEGREDLCDISITNGSFEFVDQKVTDKEYILEFTGSFNNWGTEQEILDNKIHITKDEVWFDLNEPFEGDGTDEALEKVLSEWLKTHTFQKNLKEEFDKTIENVLSEVRDIQYSQNGKIIIQKVIKLLEKANTYIK